MHAQKTNGPTISIHETTFYIHQVTMIELTGTRMHAGDSSRCRGTVLGISPAPCAREF